MMSKYTLLDSLSTSFIWCFSLFFIHFCWYLFSENIIPGFDKIESRKQRKAWYNRGVSTVHASVMFSLAVYYWVYINPRVEISDAGHRIEALSLDIMMGYLYYDILYESLTTRQTDALSHHFLGLVSHLSSRLSRNKAAAFYSMLVYIAEGSTPFLNISWLMHLLSLKKTLLFKTFAVLLIITFFTCRILLGPFMVYHMITHREEWGPDGRGALFIGNTAIVSLFALLNFYWFYKLLAVASASSRATTENKSTGKVLYDDLDKRK